jgi:hypothetical protein
MKVKAPSRPSRRRLLFVVSRELPDRQKSLAYAFDGDDGVRVIFDRRRADRRQRTGAPALERRHRDRRSAARDWLLQSAGWIRIDAAR